MTTMDRVAEPLQWFFDRVYDKMSSPKNVAKGHWGEMTKEQIIDRIRQETNEAEDETDPEKSIKEFCDIAAFAMMGADNARRSGESGTSLNGNLNPEGKSGRERVDLPSDSSSLESTPAPGVSLPVPAAAGTLTASTKHTEWLVKKTHTPDLCPACLKPWTTYDQGTFWPCGHRGDLRRP